MAVVNINSDLIHDYLDDASRPPEPERARGRYVSAIGTVLNGAADSNGSTYHLADIPSNAILHEDTFFDVASWGFAQVVIGTFSDTDALVDQTKATAPTVTPVAMGDAKHGKAVWEVLGMAKDPGAKIAIYAHAEADATGAGNMPFRVAYLVA